MNAIRTVLCPVDFSAASPRQVGLASDLCRLFHAQLVLHHNIAALAPGGGVGWMWAANHPPESEAVVHQHLIALADKEAPGLEVEVSITQGPPSAAVRAVSDAVRADLVVLSTHHTPHEDAPSLTEQILEDGKRSVLVLHDAGVEAHAFGFDFSSGHHQVTIVPTDLTPESCAAVAFALEMARTLPLELHLLHLVARAGKNAQHARTVAECEARMRALIPEDVAVNTRVHVREGDPAHGILQIAGELAATCIVMGEHTRAPIRRWITRDTSRGVLHEAPCPVWYIPGHPDEARDHGPLSA